MSNAKPRVVLTCGLDGSGKTTFAKQLETSGYVRLSIDGEVWRRIESGVLNPESDVRLVSISIEEDIRARLVDLVRNGQDVVVDYSFAARRSRDAYRKLVEENGGVVEIVYFRLTPEMLHERARRDATGQVDDQGSESGSIDRYIDTFEEPAEDENPIVIDAMTGESQ